MFPLSDDEELLNSEGSETEITALSAHVVREMQDIVMKTWLDERSGVGYDAGRLKHKRIQVKRVYRIHNQQLFDEYRKCHIEFNKKVAHLPHGFWRRRPNDGKSSELVQNSILTAAGEEDEWKYYLGRLDPHINEQYLFHGTRKYNIPKIAKNGLDIQKAQKGLYGKALYFAESAQKSDQYAGMFALLR